MRYEFRTKYTEAVILQAVKRFWLKTCGMNTVWAILFVFFWAFMDQFGKTGKFLLGCSIGLVILEIMIYFFYRHRSLSLFRKFKEESALWYFSDDEIGAESDLGKVQYKWTIIKKIYRFPECWLLIYPSDTFSTLPTEGLSDEIKDFIIARVKSAGGKVE